MATVTYLIVGGGGGGGKGGSSTRGAGGGGAGGMLTGTITYNQGDNPLLVVVGVGGAPAASSILQGSNGGNSSITGVTAAVGGGGGGSGDALGGVVGGSGGGAGDAAGASATGAAGTVGQGSAGGNNATSAGSGGSGGGGGGAGGVGAVGVTSGAGNPAGGIGTANSISGASVTYAAGGPGGGFNGGANGVAGASGLGNGGGGGQGVNGLGGNGGLGTVILSYPTGTLLNMKGGTITTSGGNTIHTFNSTGTFASASPDQAIFNRLPRPVPPFSRMGPRRQPMLGSTIPTAPAAPATPSSPTPTDAGTAYYSTLSWVSARGARFDIYLGTTVSPPLLVSKNASTSYKASLLPSTTYYWQIVAFNDGGSATGPVWSFTTPEAYQVITKVAGALVAPLRDSISIRDILNAAPNTGSASFLAAPVHGQSIVMGLGSLDPEDLIFGGEIQTNEQTYEDSSTNGTRYPVSLIDYTFVVNKRRPFGTWVNVSASIIARYLVAVYAPTCTTNNVAVELPAISIIFDGSEDFMTCYGRIANAINGRCYIDYSRDLHLSVAPESTDVPDPIDSTHGALNNPPLRFSTDLSQARTRVYGRGHGEAAPTDVAIGETIVPIVDAVMFNSSGGSAVCGITADGSKGEVFTYAGKQAGGNGSLVGPGAAPSAAPVAAAAVGSGLGTGVYQYAYTDVTASGESLPSPLGSVSTGPLPTPTTAIGVAAFEDGVGYTAAGFNVGDTVSFVYTWSPDDTGTHETSPSPAGSITLVQHGGSSPGFMQNVRLTIYYSPDPNVQYLHVWANVNGAGYNYKILFGPIPNNTAGSSVFSYLFTFGVSAIALPSPAANLNQVSLSAIATGPAAVTSRKVYRTAVGASQLKLLSTIANNTATTLTDSAADSALGANVPTSDTSALSLVAGQVNAGSTSLLTASAGPFSTSGGWVSLGSQTVRYTGISGNSLTGIPASGAGSIINTVVYGSPVLPAPALTGVNRNNGLRRAIAKGSTIHIFVQRDDLSAQAALGLLELDENGNPTDGIREYFIVDERRGEDSLNALCDADLAQQARPVVLVQYTTRDVKSRSGKPVSIDTLGVSGVFMIQEVSITFEETLPRFAVKASSTRFTFEDLLMNVALRS